MGRTKRNRRVSTNRNTAQENETEDLQPQSVDAVETGKFRVFISWSGERSKALAHALRNWLPLVLHYVDPWVSEADIDAGERWADAVASELEASNFGIICVTRQSVNAAWLLFEAGALAKSLRGSVIPLLLDLEFREISGPLAQFQAKKVEKEGVEEVVRSINACARLPIEDSRLQPLFEALWPDFKKNVEAIPTEMDAEKASRPQGEVLEELVGAVRSLDTRMREEPHLRSPKFRRGRINLFELIEMSNFLVDRRQSAKALLVLASYYRDDAPWTYELAQDVYRAARMGRRRETHQAIETLHYVVSAPKASSPDDYEVFRAMQRIVSLGKYVDERWSGNVKSKLADTPELKADTQDTKNTVRE